MQNLLQSGHLQAKGTIPVAMAAHVGEVTQNIRQPQPSRELLPDQEMIAKNLREPCHQGRAFNTTLLTSLHYTNTPCSRMKCKTCPIIMTDTTFSQAGNTRSGKALPAYQPTWFIPSAGGVATRLSRLWMIAWTATRQTRDTEEQMNQWLLISLQQTTHTFKQRSLKRSEKRTLC